ncbi:MAG: ATP-binding cassette domain-containing protein, partial [Actinobacteria bacterium]|nr:ATP-binding cassette domain-containing protein [Actinomycetota bacterium]
MLEIEDLTVSIEGKELLRDINLSIAEGETRMLFGENGSGKTSLLMAIMGLGPYRIERGRILFKGEVGVLGEKLEELSPLYLAAGEA